MTENGQLEHRTGDVSPKAKRHLIVAWIATAVTLATYFILMLAVALAPAILTQAVTAGSALTLGIVAGFLIILFLILAAAVFTIWNNKLDSSP